LSLSFFFSFCLLSVLFQLSCVQINLINSLPLITVKQLSILFFSTINEVIGSTL